MAGRPRVRTFAELLAAYKVHTESKSAGPEGALCGRATRGLLRRVEVTSSNATFIGKESNRLEERESGLLHASEEHLVDYGRAIDDWEARVLPALRQMSVPLLVELSGLSRRALQRIRNAGVRPRSYNRTKLDWIVSNLGETSDH